MKREDKDIIEKYVLEWISDMTGSTDLIEARRLSLAEGTDEICYMHPTESFAYGFASQIGLLIGMLKKIGKWNITYEKLAKDNKMSKEEFNDLIK